MAPFGASDAAVGAVSAFAALGAAFATAGASPGSSAGEGASPCLTAAACSAYLEEGGQRVRRAEFEANLASKLADATFTQDIEQLLAPTIQ